MWGLDVARAKEPAIGARSRTSAPCFIMEPASREQALDAVRAFHAEHGRPPRRREWDRATASRPCTKTIERRWGRANCSPRRSASGPPRSRRLGVTQSALAADNQEHPSRKGGSEPDREDYHEACCIGAAAGARRSTTGETPTTASRGLRKTPPKVNPSGRPPAAPPNSPAAGRHRPPFGSVELRAALCPVAGDAAASSGPVEAARSAHNSDRLRGRVAQPEVERVRRPGGTGSAVAPG
jgi:hypothetical protein